MFLLLLLLFSFTRLLQAREGSLFVLEGVPAANLNLTVHPERIPSALLCSMKCLGENDTGRECYVFSHDNTTQTCSIGNLGELDNSEVDNTTTLVWKHKGCIAPDRNPRYGRWYCVMKIKTERCFLVCNPGYVAKSYRGLYCNFIGNQAAWERPINDYKCLQTVPAILGGDVDGNPISKSISTFGQEGQVVHKTNIGAQFKRFVVQFFRGIITYCGGHWTISGCFGLDDFDSVGRNLKIPTKRRVDSASVIVQDRYYIIGGDTAQSWAQSEYILEKDGLSHPGMLTPEVAEAGWFSSCAIRYTDKSFINIIKEMVTEYDIISGTSRALPNLNIPRRQFGCDSFLDKDEELVFLVAGGDTDDSAKSAEIFKPSVGKWTMIGNLTYPRLRHVVVTATDGVFVIGGERNTAGKVEKLDLNNMTWIDTGLIYNTVAVSEIGATAIPVDIVPP